MMGRAGVHSALCRSYLLEEDKGVVDSPYSVNVDDQPLLVRREQPFGRRVEQGAPLVEVRNRLDERRLGVEPGPVDRLPGLPEAGDYRGLGLVDDEEHLRAHDPRHECSQDQQPC